MKTTHRYIPALSFDFLTPAYDAAIRTFFDEEGLKRPLIEQVRAAPGRRILDVGCGTATLTLQLARLGPAGRVVGLDGDPRILRLARRKVEKAGARVELVEGLATALPFPDAAFDHVATSLVLHHLTSADKRTAFAEMFRVLRPGGALHVLDFGRPRTRPLRALGALMRHFEHMADNIDGRLPEMARAAGFAPVEVVRTSSTMLGAVALLRAVRPA